jgi:hypothetical protein
LILLNIGLVNCVLAFDEPDGFRGVPWGATEEQLRDKVSVVGGRCEEYPRNDRWRGDRYCEAIFQIGGVDVEALYAFRSGKLVRVNLDFRSSDFDHLAAIFVERYGAPTGTTQEPYKTQGGLETTNKILRWTGPNVIISLRQYAGRITNGSAALMTKADAEEAERLQKEQTKGAAKGL